MAGNGTVNWAGDVTVTQTGRTANGTNFALLSDATPGSQGIRMRITSMSAADPIHNVHVGCRTITARASRSGLAPRGGFSRSTRSSSSGSPVHDAPLHAGPEIITRRSSTVGRGT